MMFLTLWNYAVAIALVGAVIVIGGTILIFTIDFFGWLRQKRKKRKML